MQARGYKYVGSAVSVVHSQWPWWLRIAIPLMVLCGFVVVATCGYRLIEPRYSWLDSLYMTIISVTTVGYGEVHVLTPSGRAWTIFVIISGLVAGAVAMSMVVAMIVEGQVRSIFGRRQLERKIIALSGHVIVCGYGRMGKLVAEELTAAGRKVVVVDPESKRTQLAGESGLLYVLGDAQDEATLSAAGIDRAKVLVAALPTDAGNVFVTLSARQMNPKLNIIARARDASARSKLITAGATRVVCPHILGAAKMAAVVLRPAVVDFVEVANRGVQIEMDQLQLPEASNMVGKSLKELSLPQRIGVQVSAVQRAGQETIYQPDPDFVLASGDVLVLVGKGSIAAAMEKLEAEL